MVIHGSYSPITSHLTLALHLMTHDNTLLNLWSSGSSVPPVAVSPWPPPPPRRRTRSWPGWATSAPGSGRWSSSRGCSAHPPSAMSWSWHSWMLRWIFQKNGWILTTPIARPYYDVIVGQSLLICAGFQVVPAAASAAEHVRGCVEEHQRAGRGGVRGELWLVNTWQYSPLIGPGAGPGLGRGDARHGAAAGARGRHAAVRQLGVGHGHLSGHHHQVSCDWWT